jgi:nitric oxide synthase-interacting protein
MPRHSKNNTALGFFTRQEKQQLGYGTQRVRIGRASCRDFDVCYLCLQCARDPVICQRGHLTCRECVLKLIIQQKQDNECKRQAYERQLQELEQIKSKEELEKRQKVIKDFESSQLSVLPSSSGRKRTIREDGRSVIAASKEQLYGNIRETARGAVLIKESNRDKNFNVGISADEKSMSSFWIVILLLSVAPTLLKEPSTDIKCFGSDPPHKLMASKLVTVNFIPVHKNGKAQTHKHSEKKINVYDLRSS